jgi:hypothetical protein
MRTILLLTSILAFFQARAQMCPGGGVDFNSAVTFDPAWIYGCNTGTSCNGGVHFDNRVSCQPTTSLDACAPAPTCGGGTNGSNIWFKFYAASSTVTLAGFQNTSFVFGIQAFRGGPTCGSLTTIGCAVAGGPSSGVSLTMTGLTVGQLYYYRVFGSSTPVSQRTGLYCFCGTTGIQDFILPTGLTGFKGFTTGNKVQLSWAISDENISSFEIEKSADGLVFITIGHVTASRSAKTYTFNHIMQGSDVSYFRLKIVSQNNPYVYSPVVALKPDVSKNLMFVSGMSGKQLEIRLSRTSNLLICNSAGIILNALKLSAGNHNIPITSLPQGVYFIRNTDNNDVQKFIVGR